MTTNAPEPDVLNSKQAAEFLGLKLQTLAQMRCEGRGPAFCRKNRRIRYLRADLMAWLESGRVEPVGDA